MLRISILLTIIASASVFAFRPRFYKIRRAVEEGHASKLSNFTDRYLEQPLDHFDPLVQTTYRQRYWVNSDNFKRKDGPVFLYIGGEGALSSAVVEKGEHVDLAKTYGAMIFAVEHRYYGKSINDDGLALENLQYLSSQQALADLAAFHAFASKTFNLTQNNTCVCFGGSYPGSLSAWFRIKYPHLVYGAISSSAPVRAQVNFEGYNNVVAHSLADPLVNGSKQCADNIRIAFAEIDSMFEKGLFEKLAKDFNSCEMDKEEEDIFTFVSNLADIFMGTVQYNAERSGVPNITNICAEMTNSSFSAYDNLKRLIKTHDESVAKLLGEDIQSCNDNLWSTSLKVLRNTTVDADAQGVGIRQWMYQTCSQFGYYQTCDNATSCLFSRHMTLEKNLRICSEVFAIATDEVYKRVDFTNAYYGSSKPAGSRIVFVNGSIDPWHWLGVLRDLEDGERAIYIPGTAHCANMHSASPDDPPALVQARKAGVGYSGQYMPEVDEMRLKMISSQIGQWLSQARISAA